MRTANPALNKKTFADFGAASATDTAMTLSGTVNKTAIMLALVFASAIWTWDKFFAGDESVYVWMGGGALVGLILAFVIIFKKNLAPRLAPLYALAEGLFLGGISSIFEAKYPGIVVQAVGLTFGILFCLLVAYRSGLIKATENFKLGVVAATGGICLLYMVSFIMSFFGASISFIHEGGTWGILFSLFVVVIASLNLVLDFDFIESGVEMGAPKYMEWYGAFGLMVTLIWLYIEILRLLAKTRRR